MKYRELFIHSLGESIRLCLPTKYEGLLENSIFWKALIPDVSIKKSQQGEKPFTVSLFEDSVFSFALKKKSCVIRHDFSPSHIKDIVVVIGYLLEREHQKNSFYTIHGSVVSYREKAVALIGGLSGMGKTSLGLYLVSKKWRFNSDEKFILDPAHLSIVGCTSKLLINKKLKMATKKYNLSRIHPEGIQKNRLEAIIFPILVRFKKEYESFQYNNEKAFWHLYEEATRDIRLLNGLIHNFSFPLPSLDTHDIAVLRARNVRKVISMVPVFFVKGTKQQIYNFLMLLTNTST